MDAAGSIVGVLSLAITICDGVISYCRSWRTQDDDVRAITALVMGLKQLLEDINTRLGPNPALDPKIFDRVKTCIQDCTKHINSVVCLSDKYATGQTSGLKGKAKDVAHKLKFPFEKKALHELRDIMIAFRGNVDTALQILTIDLALTDLETVQAVRRENSAMHSRTLDDIQNASAQITQSFTTELAQSLPALESDMTSSLAQRIDYSASCIDNAISQSSVAIRNDIQSSLVLQQMQMNALQEHKLQLQSLAQVLTRLQPANRLEDDHCASLGQSYTLGSRAKKPRQMAHSLMGGDSCLCNCNPTRGTKKFYSSLRWGFGKQYRAYLIHDRTCPLWYTSKQDTRYGVDLLFLQKLRIFGSVHVGWNPYAAISGLSITQNLTCSYVVPRNAPSFRVLDMHLRPDRIHSNSDDSISNCLRDLRIVFQAGHGSPRDTLSCGTNLLGMAFTRLNDPFNDSWKLLLRISRELTGMGVRLSAVESVGADYPNWISSTLYDHIFHMPFFGIFEQFQVKPSSRAQGALTFLSWLAKERYDLPYLYNLFPFAIRQEPWHSFKTVINAQRQSEEFAAEMECGVLSMAVLRQDEIEVEKLLQHRPGLLNTERNILGHTAIHLAIGWPKGLKALLAAADESTWRSIVVIDSGSYQTSALDYAISFGCIESIRLLADADLPFDFDWNLYLNTKTLNPEVSEAVLALILERFQHLQNLAHQNLSSEDIQELNLEFSEFLEENARSLLDHFRKKNMQMPIKFRPYRRHLFDNPRHVYHFCPTFGGIFHQRGLNPEAAEALYNAGFLSVNYEVKTITPLMAIGPLILISPSHASQFFRLVEFLVSKGARLDKNISFQCIKGKVDNQCDSQRQYRAVHRITSICWGKVIQPCSLGNSTLPSISRLGSTRIWREILGDSTSDPCDCACSSGGCRPIVLALKHAIADDNADDWDTIFSSVHPKQIFYVVQILDMKIKLLEGLTGQLLDEDVVRFLTFSRLGLTHTCCRHNLSFFPERNDRIYHPMIWLKELAEIHEIHDEEQHLIDRLDRLVEQFMKQFHELRLPLTVFLREHWFSAMEAELREKDAISENEKEQFTKLGVKILEDDHAENEEESDNASKEDDWQVRYDKEYEEWIRGLARSIQ